MASEPMSLKRYVIFVHSKPMATDTKFMKDQDKIKITRLLHVSMAISRDDNTHKGGQLRRRRATTNSGDV